MEHWFLPRRFLPRKIEYNATWQRLPESYKEVYRFLCWHSYLTKHSPTRRYCEWTYGQIAEHVGLTSRQVGTIMRSLMGSHLIYRWYPGDSGSGTATGRPKPPRYELPASNGMVHWWKRTRRKKSRGRV